MISRRIFPYILIISLLLASGCGKTTTTGGGGGIPDDPNLGQPIARSQGEADFLDQTFDFSMNAVLDDYDVSTLVGDAGANLAPAYLNSDWSGTFTIDADGHLNGNGTLISEATIFNVDPEDWCGYAFTELADHEFEIKGQMNKEGEKYLFTVKIWDLNILAKDPPLGPPEATCADPDSRYADPTAVKMMVGLHRNAMINLVLQHLHQELENKIEMGVELVTEAGSVEYRIFISPKIVSLDE
jgi:hypothetical protein